MEQKEDKIKIFDIEERVYNFSLDIIEFVKRFPRSVENGVLVRQLIRSGTSIGANVHEARGGASRKDFANFFSIAVKSANETIYWLRLLGDNNRFKNKDYERLLDESRQITKIVAKISISSRRLTN